MAKCCERAGEFQPAAADVGRAREHFDRGIRSSTAWPGLAAFWPLTSTSPAMISACAFSRDSASPRSTSSRSSRWSS